MDILRNDQTMINVIRAGNDNLFRSKIFSNTIASLIGQEIEIYNTTGAIGAARASGSIDGNFDKFGENLTKNDHVTTFSPQTDNEPYQEAYQNWKQELEIILKNK
jgi:xylulokinase